MKKLFLFLLLLLTTISNSQTVTYTSDNTNFANPERGWYKYTKANSIGTYSFLSQSSLTTMRTSENISLILRIYDLGAFKTTPISQAFLDNIQADFNTLRASGVKCILRFRYSESNNVDATKDVLINHINQLKSITLVNQDVIHVVEAGFIGQYGEWYYTSNYGDRGVLSTQNIADRKEIGLKIMELAPTRLVMFRTPYFQQMIGGTTPISSITAYDGSINSRTGLHNDAFLSSNSDSGTYKSTSTEWLKNMIMSFEWYLDKYTEVVEDIDMIPWLMVQYSKIIKKLWDQNNLDQKVTYITMLMEDILSNMKR